MKLETSNAPEVLHPTPAQIADALASLPGGDESFAILATGPQTYVQVAGSPREGFAIEYRDGSEDKHFEAAGSPIDLPLATSIFQRYATGDASWQGLVSWQSGTAGSLGPTPPSLKVLCLMGVVVAIGLLILVAAT